jgi:hypothetical protein
MHYGIDTLKYRVEFSGVGNIPDYKLEAVGKDGVSRGKIVIDNNVVSGTPKSVRGMASNVAGPSHN